MISRSPLLILLAAGVLAFLAPAAHAGEELTSPTLLVAGTGHAPAAQQTGFLMLGTLEQSRRQTEISAVYDEESLRIFLRAKDRPRDQWIVTQYIHDGPVWEDDSVEIFIDPTNERESYWHLIINPAGTTFDQFFSQGAGHPDRDIAGLRVSVLYGPDWWKAYINIPFRSLGIPPPAEGDQWAFNATRTIPTGEREWDYSSWSPVPGNTFHSPRYFGFLEFGPRSAELFEPLPEEDEKPDTEPAPDALMERALP